MTDNLIKPRIHFHIIHVEICNFQSKKEQYKLNKRERERIKFEERRLRVNNCTKGSSRNRSLLHSERNISSPKIVEREFFLNLVIFMGGGSILSIVLLLFTVNRMERAG